MYVLMDSPDHLSCSLLKGSLGLVTYLMSPLCLSQRSLKLKENLFFKIFLKKYFESEL